MRKARGVTSYHAGVAAEEAVARQYERAGLHIAARRWRGKGGEIDLIARDGATAERVGLAGRQVVQIEVWLGGEQSI